jgi:hypothetical protein
LGGGATDRAGADLSVRDVNGDVKREFNREFNRYERRPWARRSCRRARQLLNDIGAGEYAAAYGYLAPGALNLTQAQFVASEQQANIQSVEFTGSLGASSGSSATVDVASLKTVDGQYGCRTWTGSYQMTLQGNQWLIERSNITPQACSG